MDLAKIIAAQRVAEQAAKAKSVAEQEAKAKSVAEQAVKPQNVLGLLLAHNTNYRPPPPNAISCSEAYALETSSAGLKAILCAQPKIAAAQKAGALMVAIEAPKIVIVVDISNMGGKVSRVIHKALIKYKELYRVLAVYVVGSDLSEDENLLLYEMFGDIYHINTYIRNVDDSEVEEVDKRLAEIIRTASHMHRGMNRLVCFTGDGNLELGNEGISASIMHVVEKGVDLEICAPIGAISSLYKDDPRITIVDLKTFTSSASSSPSPPPSGGSAHSRSPPPSGGSAHSRSPPPLRDSVHKK
jgi:hypothetical protein